MNFNAKDTDFEQVNTFIKNCNKTVTITNCCGQRFLGIGLREQSVEVFGTPGNALGAYLDGAKITVHGNAQDAVGDTMNEGEIIINGNAGDALGYAMRGGKIYVKGNAGYRAGVHMKEYKPLDGTAKRPIMIVGGSAGSFLGEYLAGGLIIVLGLNTDTIPVGNFTGTGMHGGAIFIRSKTAPNALPPQVNITTATKKDMQEISMYITEFGQLFSLDTNNILQDQFYKITPNEKSPYKQLYTAN